MRITSRMMMDLAVQRMNQRLSQFERAQRDLATGRRIHVASDDVAGMNTAIGVRGAVASNAQAQRNARDGLQWTDLADARLGTLVDQMQRVRELTISANNSTTGPDGLRAIAVEIGEIAESFVATANARHQGRPLFAGQQGTNPVVNSGGVWTYQGDQGIVQRRVSETEQVTVNVTGYEVFGFADGENVFGVLDTLAADIQAGNLSALGTSIDALDRAMGRLLDGRARLGSAANRIEGALFRAQAEEVSLRTQLSETEDTDMAEAVMELQIQEVAYQAAQGALSRTLQPSLATFLG